ncbi:hypothetical protein FCIRC_10422 [Fusarium circinatum]|uniref:Uncharacterized protein n=1 Tax=Fusarium circinatum TaxID=48490 RepID=A0A8H5WPL1_FUSCI|nr:hypothetical protein FCIRC_10422 [Fusarium circinatum]
MIAFILFCAALVTADLPVPNLGPELSEDIGFKETRLNECNAFIQNCAPTIASCASVICKECTGLGQKVLNACCATESEPASCLGPALRVPNQVDASITTSEPGATASSQAVSSAAQTETSMSTETSSGQTAESSSKNVGQALSPADSSLVGFMMAWVLYIF